MSDQDFFFDEDDKAAKPAAKSGSAAKSAAKAPVAVVSAVQSVSMTIAVLIGVIGILLGAIIGLFVGKSMAVPAVATTGITAPAATGGTGSAPQLSPEQLQNGQLPAGHPSIGNGSGAASSTTSGK